MSAQQNLQYTTGEYAKSNPGHKGEASDDELVGCLTKQPTRQPPSPFWHRGCLPR
jgi:hypothetical protein